MNRSILVTGGNGFIGQHLLDYLADRGHTVVAGIRPGSESAGFVQEAEIREFDLGNSRTITPELVRGIDTVVHLAGIAHQGGVSASTYSRINTNGTAALVRAALESDIKRFVFLSTVKVHGDVTRADEYMDEFSALKPEDNYAASKLEAEYEIKRTCNSSSMKYTILRPPLVYGPGVKANFRKLVDMIGTGIPLPLTGIHNRRSFVYVGNLCSLIGLIIEKDMLSSGEYLVKDYDLSTTELARGIAESLGVKPRFFTMPEMLKHSIQFLPGGSRIYNRVFASLYISDARIRSKTGWTPVIKLNEAISTTVSSLAGP